MEKKYIKDFNKNLKITGSLSLASIVPKVTVIVKVMIFPVVMYRCDSGIIKKAEC